MKFEINLWDGTFNHLETPDGCYSMVHQKKPKKIKYVSKRSRYDGVTIFTDHFLNPVYINSVKSKYKIGWFIERAEINPNPKILLDSYINSLDFLMTNDVEILNKYPNKAVFVPFGGTWIKDDNYGLHKKRKEISMIYSNKRNRFQGYNLRHAIAGRFKNKIDLFGSGCSNPIDSKEEGLSDYRYTVVIENIKKPNYFTEKLVDAFMVGAIPIYWGCPNIGDFFDEGSILTFNNLEELEKIIDGASSVEYNQIKSTIQNNFEIAKNYCITEDWIYENIIKELLYV